MGMAVYLFSAVSCSIAWVRGCSVAGERWLAGILAILEWGLFLDVVFNVRWLLHDLLDQEAIAKSIYSQRFGPQVAAMWILGAAAAIGVGFSLVSLRGRSGAQAAVCGAIISISCWCAEVISLHAIDAVLHATKFGIMLVCLGWIAGSLMTGIGVQRFMTGKSVSF
jgi:hypothetical protein